PADVWPDVGGLDVTLASTAMAGFQGAMEQLVQYPYGCAEQLSSRLVPFLALRELGGAFGVKRQAPSEQQAETARWLGFDKNEVPDPDVVARKTVHELLQLEDGDGGFRYWASSRCDDAWVSSYATLALARAKELGYDVDAAAVSRAQQFLVERVAGNKMPMCYGHQDTTSATERAFALWVLARTGKPAQSYIDGVFRARKEMPLFARAMLADAAAIGGKSKADNKLVQTLVQELMNASKETAREVHFEEAQPSSWARYWSSDVRTSAIVLMMLVDAEPQHPFVPKIAAWLGTQSKGTGRYRTTQDAAFALMAMSEVVRATEREAPDFKATVSLASKSLIEQQFQGRSLDAVQKSIPMSALGAKAATLSFQKTGTGTLSYTASLRYAKKTMPTTANDAGIAVQRWFEPWLASAGSGQAHRVRAGELMRLRVRVATSAARSFVAVDVPIPAGLEIVDQSLASSARLPGAGDGEGEGEGDGDDDEHADPNSEMWSPWSHTELRDDRAVLFADDLPPGVNTATIAVRATTPGVFVLQPATGAEMYTPETAGRSDGGTFEVVAQ
ncbi:MAG TPA: alpha-2-macroglobulin, partial [Myxococcota bacterium]